MKRRLPDVNRIVADVKATVAASQMTKEASTPAPEYTVPLAQGLQKLAAMLKDATIQKVTYADVNALGEKLLGTEK